MVSGGALLHPSTEPGKLSYNVCATIMHDDRTMHKHVVLILTIAEVRRLYFLPLFVSLSVCSLDYSKSYERIFIYSFLDEWAMA